MQFRKIKYMATVRNFTAAAEQLRQTVFDMHPAGQKSLFELLTGFENHGSIVKPAIPVEVRKYQEYANSEEFKKLLHVATSRTLDATRTELAMKLAAGEFFAKRTSTLVHVLNNVRVLFYTAQLDSVFPASKMERLFKKLQWRGSAMFWEAARKPWYQTTPHNAHKVLLGYEKVAGAVMYNTVLFGGHQISFDQSAADELLQKSGDLLLPATNDNIPREELKKMRNASRVRLPSPCASLKAYSGFIPVGDERNSTYLFFLHIKSQVNSKSKPLLLWMQGGPGKSALFGQFLENGPLGIDATGNLFRRRPAILSNFNVVYLDAPAGSGYSFDTTGTYPSTLEESSVHTIRFLRRFLRIFPEYHNREFFIAGESYGARSAIGLAERVLSRPTDLPCRLKGVMLGVGFVFPLLQIINSADYLYYSGLLDDHGRSKFAERFQQIQRLVDEQKPVEAVKLLSRTVLNMHDAQHQSLFEELTGFQSHANIIRDRISRRFETYMSYANSSEFKKIIHVSPTRSLDATRFQLALTLAVEDFFVDKTATLVRVLNSVPVLFYTAQLDAVFPSVNLERSFWNLNWTGTDAFQAAPRKRWYHVINGRKELMGYQKIADTVMYTTLLVSGHLVSFDQSEMVIDLYHRFLKFTDKLPIDVPSQKCGNSSLPCWPVSIVL
ncbi:hypothetical protein MTO96_024709 [Rhipicephalus appendiculatus]